MPRLINERYELGPQRGIGPVGVVFKALDRQTGQAVAVKILNPTAAQDAALLTLFLTPIPAERSALLPTLDTGQVGGHPYRVTSFVNGPNLAEWLARRQGPLSPPQISALAAQVAAALGRRAHGNLKPTNILLEGRQIRLSDAELPSPPGVYTALEVAFEGVVTPRADVYSMGMIVRELWREAAIPDAVREVLAQATDDDPAHRHESLGAFSAALRAALEQRPASTKKRAAPQTAHPSRGLIVLAATGVALLAAILVIGAVALLGRQSEPGSTTHSTATSPPTAPVAAALGEPLVTPTPGQGANRPTLPPTWTATSSPTLTPRSLITRQPTTTQHPTLAPEQLADTYWEGDGLGSMWEWELPGGSFGRFTIFPINLWVGAYNDLTVTDAHETAIRNAINEINRVVPLVEVPTRQRYAAHITLWLMSDADFRAHAACGSYHDIIAACAVPNYTDAGILLSTVWIDASDECFTETVLHELTHALGLRVHSPYPEDIMYFQQTCDKSHYSERDLATLRALYAAPPYARAD